MMDKDGRNMRSACLGVSLTDTWRSIRLIFKSEESIGRARIDEWFTPEYFRSKFWVLWSTLFGFEPWHGLMEYRRYLRKFPHLAFKQYMLNGTIQTPQNQYDAVIAPMQKMLSEQGVHFHTNTRVVDVDFVGPMNDRSVSALHLVQSDGTARTVSVEPENDVVIICNGTMTTSSSLGTMKMPPMLNMDAPDWKLWHRIVEKTSDCGNPGNFDSQVDNTTAISFTLTIRDPLFTEKLRKYAGGLPSGLIVLRDSPWWLTLLCYNQPYFPNQPADTAVYFGYALDHHALGQFVKKPITQCSGEEILTELLSQMGCFTPDQQAHVLQTDLCIPCLLPFTSSQFVPRLVSDRPEVVPKSARNFAFVSQFCEIPNNTVWTVDFSVHAAVIAVKKLLNPDLNDQYMGPLAVLAKVLFYVLFM